jgi:hypothetical protein
MFASTGLNLRPWLEPHPDAESLVVALRDHWSARIDRYSEERSLQVQTDPERADMAYLGG